MLRLFKACIDRLPDLQKRVLSTKEEDKTILTEDYKYMDDIYL